MDDVDTRHQLLRDLRQQIELERGFGVDFVPRPAAPVADLRPPSAPPTGMPAAVPPAPRRPARLLAGAPGAGQQDATPAPAEAIVSRPAAVPAPPPSAAAAAPVPPTAPLPPRDASARAAAPVAPAPPAPADAADATDAVVAGAALAAIAEEIAACTRCGLCTTRTRTVPGEGPARAELLFVGEGPGEEEDRQGRPFVGAAGALLGRMIQAMGLRREEVYIVNVVKCRPPGNRTPLPDEVAGCLPYLRRQIDLVAPRVICTLGNTPLRALMGNDQPGVTRVRGTRLTYAGRPLIPTFHPSYLLRNAEAKKPCWEDLQVVLQVLGRTPPPRSAGPSAG